jgi:hypothetical protein
MQKTVEKEPVWSPTQVQFLYRHRNRRYYVRTFAGGKEKWTSLKTKLLTVARNRMKDHVDAAERQRMTGSTSEAVGRLTFGEAITTYREQLQEAAIRPNTKAYREAGLKLVLRSWENVEALNVRRMTSKMVEEWLRRFKSTAQPYVARGAKTPAMNSTGASMTTIKCALDAVRQVLDVAVSGGHLYANVAKRMFKVTAANARSVEPCACRRVRSSRNWSTRFALPGCRTVKLPLTTYSSSLFQAPGKPKRQMSHGPTSTLTARRFIYV